MHTDMVSQRTSTSGLICSLLMLQKASDFTYEEFVEAVAKHYNLLYVPLKGDNASDPLRSLGHSPLS